MELSYNNIALFVKPVFNYAGLNGFNLHHLKALILIVYGIVHGQSLLYADIARHLPVDTNHRDTKKRIYRFMNNKAIDIGLLMACWCKFIVGLLYGYRRKTCYVPVMVDITWVNSGSYTVLKPLYTYIVSPFYRPGCKEDHIPERYRGVVLYSDTHPPLGIQGGNHS